MLARAWAAGWVLPARRRCPRQRLARQFGGIRRGELETTKPTIALSTTFESEVFQTAPAEASIAARLRAPIRASRLNIARSASQVR